VGGTHKGKGANIIPEDGSPPTVCIDQELRGELLYGVLRDFAVCCYHRGACSLGEDYNTRTSTTLLRLSRQLESNGGDIRAIALGIT